MWSPEERDAARARLEALEQKHGILTPAIVLEDARADSSPLHSYFDWNVRDAANLWWLHQARLLIQQVKFNIVRGEETTKTVYFVHKPGTEAGYISVSKIRPSSRTAKDVFADEVARCIGMVERLCELAELVGEQTKAVRILGLLEDLAKEYGRGGAGGAKWGPTMPELNVTS